MNKEEIQNLVCEELVKHIASLLEKGLIRAEQVQELAPMIEKAMNVRLAEENKNEEIEKKSNESVAKQESMSDEQFYEAYNSMLRVVAGEDGTEHNMVDITEIADEMERRGITNEQLHHDIAKYRESKKKSGKAAEIAQLSDAELIKRINDFREALQKGNYVTVTNPETIKLLQNEAKNRGLIGEKENNYSKREETQNPQSFEQNKGKIDITNIVRTGLKSLQIGNEEVEQASNNLSKDTQEKDIGER